MSTYMTSKKIILPFWTLSVNYECSLNYFLKMVLAMNQTVFNSYHNIREQAQKGTERLLNWYNIHFGMSLFCKCKEIIT